MSDTSTFSAVVKALAQVKDPYELKARLIPSLLMLLPLFVLIAALYHDELGFMGIIASVIVYCGAPFFLADWARDRGKSKELIMWQQWGGMPSMQLLRHSDTTIDRISKKRYHNVLSKLLGETLPSASDEAAAPQDADEFYRSASTKLRELTRDTKRYHLLFEDNISYGFRRNAIGLKPVAIVICVIGLVWGLLAAGALSWIEAIHSIQDLHGLMSGSTLIAILIACSMLFVWIFAITERAVKSVAFSYAQKLIEACETFPTSSKSRRAPEPRNNQTNADGDAIG